MPQSGLPPYSCAALTKRRGEASCECPQCPPEFRETMLFTKASGVRLEFSVALAVVAVKVRKTTDHVMYHRCSECKDPQTNRLLSDLRSTSMAASMARLQ